MAHENPPGAYLGFEGRGADRKLLRRRCPDPSIKGDGDESKVHLARLGRILASQGTAVGEGKMFFTGEGTSAVVPV